MKKEIKLSREIMMKVKSRTVKVIDLVEYLVASEGITYDKNIDLKNTSIDMLVANGYKVESAMIDNWEETIILTLGDKAETILAEENKINDIKEVEGMKFSQGYKLGWNLNSKEEIKEKVLKLFGFKADEVKNESIEEHKDGWIYYNFEEDKKEVQTSNGYKMVFDFLNNLLLVNDRKFKIELDSEYSFKALKTKIKVSSYPEFMKLLADKTFASYSYNNVAEKLYSR
jgi:hypothetical protein